MSIVVDNVHFSYERRIPVLVNSTFSVQPGQFVGIFGPNGGGKTSLLNLLLGLLTPSKGTIKVLHAPPAQVCNKIGYVPQLRRFDKQFPISVLEVVLQGCLSQHKGWGSYSKQAKAKALTCLETVGLHHKAKLPFGNLSGGQMQRTLIARALATDPEILLLDEATVGIDMEALKEIFRFFVEQRGKITILLVTHDLQFIAKEMDFLLCVNQTVVVYPPEKVCEHFSMGLYHPTLLKKPPPYD